MLNYYHHNYPPKNKKMKLIELLSKIFEEHPEYNNQLDSQEIKKHKGEILSCEEFKNTTGFKIVNIKTIPNQLGNDLPETIKLKESDESNNFFGEHVTLCSIYRTPKLFTHPVFVKDDKGISSVLTDPHDFKPYRLGCFKIDVEAIQESKKLGLFNEKFDELIAEISDMILNPKKYTHEGEHMYYIRGVF